ncbi:MAG: aminopeptidase [Clostridia bacterium]|nr:aminopeptidase [Clostridia bacterium]
MAKKEKSASELLKEQLFYERKNALCDIKAAEVKKINSYAEGYKNFLNTAKTEREAVNYAVKYAEENDFRAFEYGKKYSAGDKIYFNNRGKAIYLAVIGSENIENGINIAAAHIDSPRIDLKQCPVYEEGGMAFFKTHYYGGIKKYQWVTLPLALHGTVVLKDGKKIDICVGEKADDPVFCITDLLPHLAADQYAKTLGKAITGEGLNVLIGSTPFEGEKGKDSIKLNVLSILNKTYGIIEEDFISAELTLVPAEKARDLGFDRSMICGYGHDDRVCAYPILTAAVEAGKKTPKNTLVTILADKEETGSNGNTGMHSEAFDNMLIELCTNMGANYRKAVSNSRCLSADVNACFDPNYAEVYESKNSAFINCGVCVTKFTGSRGKSSTNDASAEYMAEIRSIFDNAGVTWQTGELGKVDQGGGGTVALIIAEKNIETVDVGVAVLSMHAPYEIISKADLYSAYKAFTAFFAR